MTEDLQIKSAVGGFRRPISVREFIFAHLSAVGEDYISHMHQLFKDELDRLAEENGRLHRTKSGKLAGEKYVKPRYHSFSSTIHKMTIDGIIEFSGREEESDKPQFANSEMKPLRRYYRIKASPDGHLNGHRDGHLKE